MRNPLAQGRADLIPPPFPRLNLAVPTCPRLGPKPPIRFSVVNPSSSTHPKQKRSQPKDCSAYVALFLSSGRKKLIVCLPRRVLHDTPHRAPIMIPYLLLLADRTSDRGWGVPPVFSTSHFNECHTTSPRRTATAPKGKARAGGRPHSALTRPSALDKQEKGSFCVPHIIARNRANGRS